MKSLVVAYGKNHEIGKSGKLLWSIDKMRDDMDNFRAITDGATVIMGRKTFESIGKPLKNRQNIVITRQNTKIDGADVAHSLEEAYNIAKDDKMFVIGGGDVFSQAITNADRIYATEIDEDFPDADTFFPQIDKNIWHVISTRDGVTNDKNAFAHKFVVYERNF